MNDRILKAWQNKNVYWCVYAVAIITTLIPIIGSLWQGYIFSDSAYYLCMVERISEGYVPYKTLCLGYTPLWFYLMAGIKWLFHIPYGCYEVYLFIHYLFLIGTAYFFYKIVYCFLQSKKLALFSGWLFFLMTHWLQGNIILLEIPSMFFGMCCCWLILYLADRNAIWYLSVGLICACSFLCKQFGFGFFFLSLYMLLVYLKRLKYVKIGYFVIGYFIPILLCFLIWETDFLPLIFANYGTITAEQAGWDVSLNGKIVSIINIFKYFCLSVCPMVLVAICSIPLVLKQNKWKDMIFCFCGVIGFVLQYYFTPIGLHYMLYMVPFAILLCVQMFTLKLNKSLYVLCCVVLCYVVGWSLYCTYKRRVYNQYVKSYIHQYSEFTKKEQFEFGEIVKSYVGEEKKMWIVHSGLVYLYYVANILPPNISTIGYSFGPLGINENDAMEQAKNADYVLAYIKDDEYESFYTDALKKRVGKHKCIRLSDDVVLYDMSKFE